jgi:hypothetical protein
LKTLDTASSLDQTEDRSKHQKISLEDSPFNYAVSYWLKHAIDVPSGTNSTSLSKALWVLVKDFFWESNGTTFLEWLRTFPPDDSKWHHITTSTVIVRRCLYDEECKSEVSSCLYIAASYGLLDILEWAHPQGLDFNIKSCEGRTPLMFAARVGETDAAKAILSKDGIRVHLDSCTSSDCNEEHRYVEGTALQNAILSQRSELIKLLLRQSSIEVDQVFHGTTALGIAIADGYSEGIQLLVSAGAKLAMHRGELSAIPSSS